jgi:hypothetical protein
VLVLSKARHRGTVTCNLTAFGDELVTDGATQRGAACDGEAGVVHAPKGLLFIIRVNWILMNEACCLLSDKSAPSSAARSSNTITNMDELKIIGEE